MATVRSAKSAKVVPVLTHFATFLLGGILVSVLGGFAFDTVKAALSPPLYHYGSHVPTCGDGAGWIELSAGTDCSNPNHVTLLVSVPPATGAAIFVDPHQAFPSDYRADVTVSQISTGACAGILMRGHPAEGTGYVAFICPSRGVWQISRFDLSSTEPLILATGALPASAQQVYSIALSTQGDIYQLLINGVVTGGGSENLFPGTQSVGLMVSPTGSAAFADFSITEIR